MDAIITQQDVDELEHIEARIERDMRNAYASVGAELKHIRDRKLYVIRFSSFGEYCIERWEMTEARATQLIQASDIYNQLTNSTLVDQSLTKVNLPSRETHVRPLLQIETSEQRAEVWKRVIENTNGTGITAKTVQAEVDRYLAELARDWITVEEWNNLDDRDKMSALAKRGDKQFNETNDNIEWAAFSWNPVTGCLHGCDYCYARDIAARFYPQKFEPSLHPARLTAPTNTKVPGPRWNRDIGNKGVFVCSMADLFGKWVPEKWITAVLGQVQANPQWNFLFLTKFPIRMAEFDYPSNVWLGTSVDRQWAVERAEKAFRKIKASGFTGICWLSCEPMLERLTFTSLDMFDWVVMGGASKSTQTEEYRPPFDDVVHLYLQAKAAECKIYQKTNLLERLREYPIGE